MKLIVTYPLWKRYHLRPIIVAQNERIAKIPGIDLEVMICGSEKGIDDNWATVNGYNYVYHPNPVFHPVSRENTSAFGLGKKMNALLGACEGLKGDFILQMGQDDICDNAYIERLMERAENGFDLVGAVDCYFHNMETGDTRYWTGYTNSNRRGEPIGCGRFLSAKLLDKAKWNLWPDALSGSLDFTMMKRLKGIVHRASTISLHAHKCVLMDLKDGHSLTKWDDWPNSKPCDFPAGVFSDKEVDLIKSYQKVKL